VHSDLTSASDVAVLFPMEKQLRSGSIVFEQLRQLIKTHYLTDRMSLSSRPSYSHSTYDKNPSKFFPFPVGRRPPCICRSHFVKSIFHEKMTISWNGNGYFTLGEILKYFYKMVTFSRSGHSTYVNICIRHIYIYI